MTFPEWLKQNAVALIAPVLTILGAVGYLLLTLLNVLSGVQTGVQTTAVEINALKTQLESIDRNVGDMQQIFAELRVTVASVETSTVSLQRSVADLTQSVDRLDGTVDILAGTTAPLMIACIAETIEAQSRRASDEAGDADPLAGLPACGILQDLRILR